MISKTQTSKTAVSTHGANWFWKFPRHTPKKFKLVHMVVLTDFENFLEIHLKIVILDMVVLTDFQISQTYTPQNCS